MFTEVELLDAINELIDAKHSVQNCEKLAAVFTVLDHLYPNERDNSVNETLVGKYGNTEFLKEISGKPARDVWILMDELIDALAVLNPKLLKNFYTKLSEIKG